MKFVVLGGGAQGSACAFELVRRGGGAPVILADAAAGGPKALLGALVRVGVGGLAV